MSIPAAETPTFAGFETIERIHLGPRTAVYRAVRERDGAPVVLKTVVGPHPSLASVRALEREFRLYRALEGAERVARALDLTPGDRPLLVLADVGARSVRLAHPEPPTLRQALRYATDAALGLQELHRHRITHCDINPSNLVVDPRHRVWLVDLGLATRLSIAIDERAPVEFLQGTLPYMSPEQTGRMNRPVDHRADFYSLGVTLYEWVTGRLPFEASDPLAWVYAHIAQRPRPAHERADVPLAVSAILDRLMAKSAEDRYQSAAGLVHDLQTVSASLESGRDLGPSFRPGAHDVPEHLQLPRRFYGRSAELEALWTAFSALEDGQRSVCLISGPAGVGKTALVSELIRPLTARRGLFLAGKYDQFAREGVYGAVVAALRQALVHLSARSPGDLAAWRERIDEQLGPSVALLTDLLPELVRIVPDAAAHEVEPTRMRLHLALGRLVRLLARPDHPLVLVLDDVQWADPASLELLEGFLLDPSPAAMMLVLLFRDAAPGDGASTDVHAWVTSFGERVAFDRVRLAPLSEEAVGDWLTDVLPSSGQDVRGLARWVHERTGGNPFFVREFLETLYDSAHLRFDRAGRGAGIWRPSPTTP